MPLKAQPDLNLDRLVTVVADALDALFVVVPSANWVVITDLMPFGWTEVCLAIISTKPEVVAPTSQAEPFVNHLRIGSKVQLNLLPDWNVL